MGVNLHVSLCFQIFLIVFAGDLSEYVEIRPPTLFVTSALFIQKL